MMDPVGKFPDEIIEESASNFLSALSLVDNKASEVADKALSERDKFPAVDPCIQVGLFVNPIERVGVENIIRYK